jgi:hypothetical protein
LSDEAGQAAGAGANKDDGSQLSMTSVEDEKMEGNMMAVIGQNIKQTVSDNRMPFVNRIDRKCPLFYRKTKSESNHQAP